MRYTLLFALATFAQAGPIPITGGGHWWYDRTIGGGEGWSVSFSGSLDGRFVSLSGDCNSPLGWCRLDTLFRYAEIDGQYFGLGAISFALGADGWIVGRDGQGNSVTESINGVWSQTSITCYAPNECEGGFAITPVADPAISQVNAPEPASIALVLAGLAIAAICRFQQLHRSSA